MTPAPLVLRRALVALAMMMTNACGRTQPSSNITEPAVPGADASMPVPSQTAIAETAPPGGTPSAVVMSASPATSAAMPGAPSASAAAGDGSTMALPEEPWFHDKSDRYDDCVAPLATPPRPHFPSPYAACDTHVESYASPPTGSELHFHYRYFSAALTTQKRASKPGVCCYMVWEFPRHH